MNTREFPSFGMFTDEGDAAVARMVAQVVTEITDGATGNTYPESRLRRLDLPARIRQGCAQVAEAGFGEVYDTEPQWDIADAVSRACLEQGWLPISRWDW